MTSTRMTIYDPEGTAYEMEWEADLTLDMVNWCALCDETITEGWVSVVTEENADYPVLIICDDCARANATTEGR